ncbi:Xre family transcriptional regulator [Marinimicrobium koreense]|uniref:Xre family transcriptional regulator n=1 Tax=Marinimicrobium koreense TaxID=306545 RepID=A0A3N1PA44_9GAMM|nr:helix-turn-helix transcriptional regulator [Marinimicrobium koreense]ROQ21556.1 Xre family transcriptional regulator [Marinimicrobium koreense]
MTSILRTTDTPFSGFLKTWRTRRRLSQLELSLKSGMSQRHISFLETGRSKPSLSAIGQLGDALDMPAAEIDAMLLSAGFAARSSQRRWSQEAREAVGASIDHVLQSHAPYPAMAVDRIWNLQKANEPALQFFAMLGSTGTPNLLREVMMPGALRSRTINWEQTARALYRLLELEVARRPHDQEAHELLNELRDISGVAEAISQPSSENPLPVLSIQFQVEDAVLSLFSLIATVGMSSDPVIDDIRLETLLPADDVTREWFTKHFL